LVVIRLYTLGIVTCRITHVIKTKGFGVRICNTYKNRAAVLDIQRTVHRDIFS